MFSYFFVAFFALISGIAFAEGCGVNSNTCRNANGGSGCKYSTDFSVSPVSIHQLKMIFHDRADFINFLDDIVHSSSLPTSEERFLSLSDLVDPTEEYSSFREAFVAKLSILDLNESEVQGVSKVFSHIFH